VRTGSVEELVELLRIKSLTGNRDEISRAVDWVCALLVSAGGSVERHEYEGVPLGVGTIPASVDPGSAPTILVYGHVDVQPPGRLEAWSHDPFDPEIRDGCLYARGAADDKGPFYALLSAGVALAEEQSLPVNLRVLCDTEEESGGRTAVSYIRDDPTEHDACLIFDTGMHAPGEPVIVTATRGIASMHVRTRVRESDVHSGTYGGVAVNAATALVTGLHALGGRGLPAALHSGVRPPSAEELSSWSLIDARSFLATAGVAFDGDDLSALRRLWAEPAVDIHGLSAGITESELNIVPATAEAVLSVRVAPGQDVDAIGESAEALLRAAIPPRVDVEITHGSRTPSAGPFDSSSLPLVLARKALTRAFGTPPVLVRTGGSLPILAALSQRGVPTILSGLSLPDSHIHGPDERLQLEQLRLGMHAARELFIELGGLRSSGA
jgi:acetylornithine deacetylase/succinyl-diaminopimelate desuccinylase-like protein